MTNCKFLVSLIDILLIPHSRIKGKAREHKVRWTRCVNEASVGASCSVVESVRFTSVYSDTSLGNLRPVGRFGSARDMVFCARERII
jgi:hypothetical protein